MHLLDYLSKNFLTKSQLLEVTGLSDSELITYQNKQVMPKASYVLETNIVCHSIFGEFKQTDKLEYYAKSYSAWINMLKTSSDPIAISMHFNKRYKEEIKNLTSRGFTSNHEKMHDAIESHIQDEWRHFLNGTYGLCTNSGLPEDIAAKEMATLIISEIIENNHPSHLDTHEKKRLSDAVALLDKVSSMFAPHEFERSSRNRLINQVKMRFLS